MSATVKSQGFSLPEVMLAMFLMVSVVTALGGYYRGLAAAGLQLQQYRLLWRYAWEQTQRQAATLPDDWQSQRLQTSSASCVSINATIITPMGKQGRMTRLHCPVSQ
ncbi:TPA: prepilin-type N-terminal cleavage/methylation domain-containing protein [Kluyvera cryocrescens]|uniref:Prepilin-type N-terminal cleavage/methylation domain-containing protein n=1 Tax=Kluyvera cryocrescens TaxID=580 RepID=A0AAW9C6L9_KLUCR|nr:prepilin-type N-terminal cleavage/methylation domain-containing protein [Kluyvera cryocrescens]MDW3777836.1 prepilin-type N-terminal cleavage/methylation domain-containing protein [Kluyvera cryocrescens]MEB6634053.1 prepilin-type N-terminal cleavage/methylation domain-containing protein [Kluyvera cryocrescens]MEB7556148.1 prepilin-type N-terminal cleavage/methylation domain-containing protein [Kluyvera cryocrescens]MEB7713789.1 prepilin-type N-terminal cleavage/methylation domain-containing 